MLILVAIEEELKRSELPEHQIEYIGVGKVNAVFNTLNAIEKYSPKQIVNFGTAGSLNKNKHPYFQLPFLPDKSHSILEYINSILLLIYLSAKVVLISGRGIKDMHPRPSIIFNVSSESFSFTARL